MKILSGREIAANTKERHSSDVEKLRQRGITPKLAIIQVKDDPVINTYVRLKKKYGEDIGAMVDIYTPRQADVPELLKKLNEDQSVHGIILQLPLTDTSQTDQMVNLIAAHKDVDGLSKNTSFKPATPLAILWLLKGNNIDLHNKKILLIGRGRLVGAPLEKMLRDMGITPEVIDRPVDNLADYTANVNIVITATGSHGVLKASMLKPGTVVVDAGVAIESGVTVGDLAPDVYERDDLVLTPQKGGVGPLTVCALFENTLRAARRSK